MNNNSRSEVPHRKRFRDENPPSLSSPEQGSNKKKRRKNKNRNMGHGALIPQDPPPSTEPSEKGTEQNGQPRVCPNPNPATPEAATEIPIAAEKEWGAEPNGVTAEHSVSDLTPRKRKRKKKKRKRNVALVFYDFPNALQVESEQGNAKEKRAESGEVSAVQLQVCHKHELATLAETPNPVVQEKKKCVELKETSVEQPQLCNKQELAPLVVVDTGKENGVSKNEGVAAHPALVAVSDSTPAKDTPQKKKREKKKKNVLIFEGLDSKGSNAEQRQVCDPVDRAVPIGVERKIVKEIGAGPDDANAERRRLRSKQELAIPVVPGKKEVAESSECGPKHEPVIPVDAEKGKGVGPNEASAEHPKLHLPISDPTAPKDTPHPQVCSDRKSASPIRPQDVIPMGAEVPADPERKLSKRKRRKMKRKSVLENEVAEPDKHNAEPPEIPVQRSMCAIATSHTDQTIPTDQNLSINSATPIVPKQKMSKRQRRRKYQIALKSKRSESDKHNTESTAEIPVQRAQGFEITSALPFKSNGETSVGEGNVEQPGNTQVQRTKGLEVTKIPFKWHGENSVRCLSCQQPGHKFTNCQRVKRLRNNEEICFFCGEIGHTLAKCSVSQAGGRFARCLFCYAHGHFTNKCPWNGHGIDRKVVAANGPVDKVVEA